jgi:hypothetical protein
MTTRSRTARAAVALLVGVLAAPLAATTAAGADYPTGERINPALLSRGPNTPLLHVEGRDIVDGDTRIPVAAPNVWMLGRTGPDYLVAASNEDYRRWRVLRVTPEGTTRRVVGGPGNLPSVEAADGGAYVVVESYTRENRTLLRVADTTTGDVVRRRLFGRTVTLLDFGKRRMVLGEWGARAARQRTFWWNPFANRTRAIADKPGYIADISSDRLGVHLGDPYMGGCQKVVALSAPHARLWRSCQDRALSFSPTGKRMLTTHILSDGPGPNLVQVRARRGRLLDTYRARWFGFDAWENDYRLLLQVAGPKAVAAVRCTVRSCEQASDVQKTEGRDPWMVMPPWTFADESLLDR